MTTPDVEQPWRTTAPPCPAAGVIGPGQSFCRDYARDFPKGTGPCTPS